MKTELVIFAILAMVVSSFLNVESSIKNNDSLIAAKSRIEYAGEAYTKAKQIKTIATNKASTKPNEG